MPASDRRTPRRASRNEPGPRKSRLASGARRPAPPENPSAGALIERWVSRPFCDTASAAARYVPSNLVGFLASLIPKADGARPPVFSKRPAREHGIGEPGPRDVGRRGPPEHRRQAATAAPFSAVPSASAPDGVSSRRRPMRGGAGGEPAHASRLEGVGLQVDAGAHLSGPGSSPRLGVSEGTHMSATLAVAACRWSRATERARGAARAPLVVAHLQQPARPPVSTSTCIAAVSSPIRTTPVPQDAQRPSCRRIAPQNA